METALKNWTKWTDSKLRVSRLKKAFDIMHQRALAYRQAKMYRKKLIVQKATMVLKRLEDTGKQVNRGKLIEAFQTWNQYVLIQKQKQIL